MKRTSLSHPLRIATVVAGSEFGRIGITFCPGKYDPHSMIGYWDRDLALDLDAIRDWGADAVVTFLEPKELILLRVESLGKEGAGAVVASFIFGRSSLKTLKAASLRKIKYDSPVNSSLRSRQSWSRTACRNGAASSC